MSKRAICSQCHYPLKTCVCSALTRINNQSRIIVIQDKAEGKNAKNTVRLLALCLQNIEIVQSDDEQAMSSLQEKCLQYPQAFSVFFPSANSRSFESGFESDAKTELLNKLENNIGHKIENNVDRSASLASGNKPKEQVNSLIFIDGTWRKAKRIYLSHDYLQNLSSFHFEEQLISHYRIRKTRIENGMSTLEAVAYVLSKAENTPVHALYALLEKMQSFWPETHNP